jgi:Sec-independent protein secretion pathway component TatC
MLLFCAPSIGYIYLNNVRKGIIYLIFSWTIGIIGLVGGYFCCFPIVLPIIFNLIIVWDVSLEAKGKETTLPSFE